MVSVVCTNYSDFPPSPEHAWPVSVAASGRMTQGDMVLCKSSEKGRGCLIVFLVVTHYDMEFTSRFSGGSDSFIAATLFISDE